MTADSPFLSQAGDDLLQELDRHLFAVWRTLHDERNGSARYVEGMIGELRDHATAPERRLAVLSRDWRSLVHSPRGLFEFNVWRETFDERVEANRVFRGHLKCIGDLLAC